MKKVLTIEGDSFFGYEIFYHLFMYNDNQAHRILTRIYPEIAKYCNAKIELSTDDKNEVLIYFEIKIEFSGLTLNDFLNEHKEIKKFDDHEFYFLYAIVG